MGVMSVRACAGVGRCEDLDECGECGECECGGGRCVGGCEVGECVFDEH